MNRTVWVLWSGLILYISLVPFYFGRAETFSSVGVTFIKYFPVFLLLFITLLTLYTETTNVIVESIKRVRTYLSIVLVYIFVCLLSLWDAPYPMQGFGRLIYYSVTGVFLPVLLICARPDEVVTQRLFLVISCALFLVALYGLFTHLTGADPLFWGENEFFDSPHGVRGTPYGYHYHLGRAFSTFGYPIIFGAYIVLTITLPCYLTFRTNFFFYKFFFLLVIFASIGGIVVSYTRGAYISVSIVLILCVYYSFRMASGSLYKVIISFLLVIGMLAALTQFKSIAEKSYNRITDLKNFSKSQEIRINRVKLTIESFEEQPWLGIGVGNANQVIEKEKIDIGPPTIDNMYLMILYETGILGFIMFNSIIIYVVYRVYHQWVFFVPLVGLCVNMVTWDALTNPTIRILFFIVIGLGLNARILNNEEYADV